MARKFAMPTPRDDHEKRCCREVVNSGAHIMCVGVVDEDRPFFQYTVGLSYNFAHPELVCFCPDHAKGATLLRAVRDHVKDGTRFKDCDQRTDLLEGFASRFRAVHKDHYREHLGWCRWFFNGDGFDAFQVLWPDERGLFPDDNGCRESVRRIQTPLWLPAPSDSRADD